MEFSRTTRRTLNLQLTPLIDVMFILIIFFMLTTSFMKVESLELLLPSAAVKTAEKQAPPVRLFIAADGSMLLDQKPLVADELSATLADLFKKDASARVMLLTADGVTIQQLVSIMDKVYVAGGKSLFVRKWDAKSKTETPGA